MSSGTETGKAKVRRGERPARSLRLRGAVGTRGVVGDLLVFLAVGLVAAAHAWTRIEATMAGYALSSAQVEHSELLQEQKALRLELATRKSSRRIEMEAKGRLGMVKPAPDRIFPIEPDAAAVDGAEDPL